MAKRYQDDILRLVNEKNDLFRDVTWDNVTMGLPIPVLDFETTQSGTFKALKDMTVEIVMKGAGGGSGGGISFSNPNSSWANPSGRGGRGGLVKRTLPLLKGDVVSYDLGKGGKGGTSGRPGDAGRFLMGTSGRPGERSYFTLARNAKEITSFDVAAGGGGGGATTASRSSAGTSFGAGNLGGDAVASILLTDANENRVYGLPGNQGQDASFAIKEVIEDVGFRNTSVSLTGILNKGYRGTTDVYYRRFDLKELFLGLDTPELRTRAIGPQDIIDQMNVSYGLELALDELVGINRFPTWEEGELEVTKPFEIKVRDDAYGWIGSVTINILNGNPLLDDVVIVQLLSILSHPDDPELLEGRRSGQLSTYEFDFTPWKDRLQIDPTSGYWANFADVQEVGKQAGLDYWYNNRVVDLPTVSVPNANPRFERVMVQQYAGGGVTGPLYFHYDQTW